MARSLGIQPLSSTDQPSPTSALQNGLSTSCLPDVSSDYPCCHCGVCLLLTGEVPRDLHFRGAWPHPLRTQVWVPSQGPALSPDPALPPRPAGPPVSCRHKYPGTTAAALLEALPGAAPPLALLRPGRLPAPVLVRALPVPPDPSRRPRAWLGFAPEKGSRKLGSGAGGPAAPRCWAGNRAWALGTPPHVGDPSPSR